MLFFRGIEKETKRCFFTTVAYRTRETLLGIIKSNILPGTTVTCISGCWKAYDILDRDGFEHLKVNHSLNFVYQDTRTHTKTTESMWRALKISLPCSKRNSKVSLQRLMKAKSQELVQSNKKIFLHLPH